MHVDTGIGPPVFIPNIPIPDVIYKFTEVARWYQNFGLEMPRKDLRSEVIKIFDNRDFKWGAIDRGNLMRTAGALELMQRDIDLIQMDVRRLMKIVPRLERVLKLFETVLKPVAEHKLIKAEALDKAFAEEAEWLTGQKAEFLGVKVTDEGLVFENPNYSKGSQS